MSVSRSALIVATDTFADPKLRTLRAPARDAEELARVLGDPEIGDFAVQVSLNEPDNVVRRKLSEFFRERGRDDLLLLHVSSHGLKDEDGTLYFATTNTDVDHLEATAIPSEFVNRQMTRSHSRRMVLLLDCCFGGAFARGFVHRAGGGVDVAESFDGRGRVVLTASRAMEWAFEGDHLEGEARPSIFTASIVEGLATGRADRDQDSRISVDELYDYVYEQVREATPNQTPSKWTFDVQGELFLARASYRPEIEPAELPLELQAAAESPLTHVRVGAVKELSRLLQGTHPGLALSARLALQKLAEDDSSLVSDAAARILKLEPGQREAVSVSDRPRAALEAVDGRKLEPAPIPVPAVGRARAIDLSAVNPLRALTSPEGWSSLLALTGAAALALGYVLKPLNGTSQWDVALTSIDPYVGNAIWFVWSPIEAFGAALLVGVIVGARKIRWVGREGTNGALVGVGVLSVAASLALLDPPYTLTVGLVLTLLGAFAILCAGRLGAATNPPAKVDENTRSGLLAGGLGAALLVMALFLDVASGPNFQPPTGPSVDTARAPAAVFGYLASGLTSEAPTPPSAARAPAAVFGHLAELGYALWLGLAVAAAVSAVITSLAYRLPRTRLWAAWLLIAIGLQSALHISGLLFQLAKFDANLLDFLWRYGGLVGLLGAALLIVAGASMLRSGSRQA